ncbi:hypothetical protein NC652_017149 [Populus alba x Populus x berolinensis]|nr:hypothetical protein NC652_017149 [Populus alba x Populus x berolinensis]
MVSVNLNLWWFQPGKEKRILVPVVTFQGSLTTFLWLCIFHESNNSSLATWKMAYFEEPRQDSTFFYGEKGKDNTLLFAPNPRAFGLLTATKGLTIPWESLPKPLPSTKPILVIILDPNPLVCFSKAPML